MTAAWVTIALLVLAVPVLAFWLGGRRFWSRVEARGAGDPAVEIMRRHGLSTREATAVVSAVTRGEALQEPGQRAAAVELAELTSTQLFPTWEEASVWRRVGYVITGVRVVLVIGRAVLVASTEGAGEVHWYSVFLILLIVGPGLFQSAKLRRAIALNSDQAPES